VQEIEARLRAGSVLRARIQGDEGARQAASDFFQASADVAGVTMLPDGTLELAVRGDDAVSADLLAGAVRAGHRIFGFWRAASDLEELFLQITGTNATPAAPTGVRDAAHGTPLSGGVS